MLPIMHLILTKTSSTLFSFMTHLPATKQLSATKQASDLLRDPETEQTKKKRMLTFHIVPWGASHPRETAKKKPGAKAERRIQSIFGCHIGPCGASHPREAREMKPGTKAERATYYKARLCAKQNSYLLKDKETE